MSLDGQTVTGVYNDGVEDLVAFTISLSGNQVTLVSNVALEHENGPQDTESDDLTLDGLVNVVATVTATDGDGDVIAQDSTVSEPLSLTITDTNPEFINPTTAHVVDLATSPDVIENLNFVTGIDGVGNVVFSTTFNGETAMDGDGNVLSFNGDTLYLYTLDDGSTIVASTEDDIADVDIDSVMTTGYYVILNDNGTYTFHSNGVIENGTAVTATNLSSVGGGNVESKVISDLDGTEQDVVLTTVIGDSVNTNNSSIGVSNAQSIEANEAIRFDFTNGDFDVDDNYVLDTDHHNETTSFRQQVSHSTGNQTGVNFTLTAILADDDITFFGTGTPPEAGELIVEITGVNIYNGDISSVNAGTATQINFTEVGDTGVFENANGTITYTLNPDGTASITGLPDDYVYEIETEDQFSAVQYDQDFGSVKLGQFSYGQTSSGEPINLSYDVTATDGDGDAVNGSVDVVLYPDEATETGDDNNNTLEGGDGIDYILAYDGDDVLTGLGGDDILVGGAGSDTMTGDEGSDTFVFSLAEDSTGDDDVITDFDPAEDALAFEDVIDANGSNDIDLGDAVASYENGGAGSDLTLHLTNGGSVTLQGLGSGDNGSEIADLSTYLGTPTIQSDQS